MATTKKSNPETTMLETAAEFTPVGDPPATSPAPPPPPAPIRTAEQWAEAKGMYPEFIPLAQPFARADAPPMMQHNPESWRYAATRAGSGWPIGKELTEAEFDAAVAVATNQTFR